MKLNLNFSNAKCLGSLFATIVTLILAGCGGGGGGSSGSSSSIPDYINFTTLGCSGCTTVFDGRGVPVNFLLSNGAMVDWLGSTQTKVTLDSSYNLTQGGSKIGSVQLVGSSTKGTNTVALVSTTGFALVLDYTPVVGQSYTFSSQTGLIASTTLKFPAPYSATSTGGTGGTSSGTTNCNSAWTGNAADVQVSSLCQTACLYKNAGSLSNATATCSIMTSTYGPQPCSVCP